MSRQGSGATGNVCAIVITYHPDEALPERLDRIHPQVSGIVIVDNGSTDAEQQMLRDVASTRSIEVIFNGENLGVARALNIGIQRAAALGYPSVLLLDQDSCVAEDMVETLLAARASFPDNERLAVIGSGFKEVTPSPDIGIGIAPVSDDWVEVKSTITSGSWLPLAAYSTIGPFRDELFIDHVDTDYCLRARAKGYHVIKTRKELMSHAIGSPTQHAMLWGKKWTTNHSADRRYYFARNDTVMLREYGNYGTAGWVWKSFRRSLRQCKRIALYEDGKGVKIGAVIHGWWDGMHGRMGPRKQRHTPVSKAIRG
jgi:rhamnosyltransferase